VTASSPSPPCSFDSISLRELTINSLGLVYVQEFISSDTNSTPKCKCKLLLVSKYSLNRGLFNQFNPFIGVFSFLGEETSCEEPVSFIIPTPSVC